MALLSDRKQHAATMSTEACMGQQERLRDLADQDVFYITLFPARCNTVLIQLMHFHEALAA